jgi:hypothetical protein
MIAQPGSTGDLLVTVQIVLPDRQRCGIRRVDAQWRDGKRARM